MNSVLGCGWTSRRRGCTGEEARAKISHRNAEAMMSRLAKVARRETIAACARPGGGVVDQPTTGKWVTSVAPLCG